eukprot:5503895-Prymnesium_polylepis.1
MVQRYASPRRARLPRRASRVAPPASRLPRHARASPRRACLLVSRALHSVRQSSTPRSRTSGSPRP